MPKYLPGMTTQTPVNVLTHGRSINGRNLHKGADDFTFGKKQPPHDDARRTLRCAISTEPMSAVGSGFNRSMQHGP